MGKYWEDQMAHGPTAHYYDALKRMVSVLIRDGYSVENVLEIGTGWGISGTVFLEAGCRQLVTVDPNMDAPYVQASLKQLESVRKDGQFIVRIRSSSDDLPKIKEFKGRRFDMIFVDGRHDYESVCRDLLLAIQVMNPKGVIICDDYTHPKNGSEYGVADAVDF
jgi:predicted O-methyltransferase YrrM